MANPKIVVTEKGYEITLFREGKETLFSFIGAELLLRRDDDLFPGELGTEYEHDEDGYFYFIHVSYLSGNSEIVALHPEEADDLAKVIRCDY